ncbi:MAG: phosphotransferase [Burkholderiales bacterium]
MNDPRMIPYDSALPPLALTLDASNMSREFSALLSRVSTLRARQWRVDSCDIIRVKYRPGRNAVIGYRLTLVDAKSGATREQFLCGGLYGAIEARSRFEAARQVSQIADDVFPAVSLIDALGMVLRAFPHDRKLGSLPVLGDLRRLHGEILPGIVEQRWGSGWKIANISSRIVSYFPEHSCTVRLDLQLEHLGSEAANCWGIYGKTRYNDSGIETVKVMRDLWECRAHGRGEFGLARPLSYQSEHRLLWQEAVEGETLDTHLDRQVLDCPLLAKVGSAVAAFQASAITAPRALSLKDMIADLDETVRLLTLVQGRTPSRVRAVVERLKTSSSKLARTPPATLHGDLHSKNILVSGDRVVLIDLDRVSTGPALSELGGLAAEILYRSLLRKTAPEEHQPLVDALIQGYRSAVPWATPSCDVRWFTAAALLRERVFRCLTSLKPGRVEIIDELVRLADQLSQGLHVPLSSFATSAIRTAAN